jgi:N-ethylmaleimide reductase
MNKLFSPTQLGAITLQNRVVMAPLTRSRSIGNIPGEIVATYYSQRSEAGLIVTEGTSPSPNGVGYARIPGLYNEAQVEGWKEVTDKVHAGGAKIFVQLMHTGRVSHLANMPKGTRVLAPSDIRMEGEVWTDTIGMQAYTDPAEMTDLDILETIAEFVTSAELAVEAGFDGVEIHAANGYLIDQFLNTASNKRSDKWGGSLEGRSRFALEIAKGIVQKIGAGKVGMRVSPYGAFNGMETDPEMEATFVYLAQELSKLKVAYLHIVDHSSMGAPEVGNEIKQKLKECFKGSLILSGGYTEVRAEVDLQENRGDLIAFGRPFISNPALVSKMKAHKPLTEPDQSTFYTPGEKGYTDYV